MTTLTLSNANLAKGLAGLPSVASPFNISGGANQAMNKKDRSEPNIPSEFAFDYRRSVTQLETKDLSIETSRLLTQIKYYIERIAKGEAELSKIKSCGLVELSVINPILYEYIRDWEKQNQIIAEELEALKYQIKVMEQESVQASSTIKAQEDTVNDQVG